MVRTASTDTRRDKWKTAKIIITTALAIMIAVLFVLRNWGLFGFTIRVIQSGSMEPILKTNSIVIVQMCDVESVEVGDIICFYDELLEIDIVHRVIGIDKEKWEITTKGDNNKYEDKERVTSDKLVGKVTMPIG